MKCPKCQYISFESGERCRNCGYEFSLTAKDLDALDLDALDLRMQTGDEPLGPLADFDLTEQPPHAGPPSRASHRGAAAPAELPLFRDRALPDDVPLVTPPAVPRAPLSVRRSTPTLVRERRPQEPVFDLESPEDLPGRVSPSERVVLPEADPSGPWALGVADPIATPANPIARLGAAAVDLLILGAIDLAILYFTLRLTRLGFEDVRVLPPIPLAAFLVLLNGGYFVLFTAAGGQTVGKMLTGIRIVPADSVGLTPGRVRLPQAFIRAAAFAVSILPLGLGYVPALIGAERRALHDRLAGTRVVKA